MWKKQDIIVETEGTYPKKVCISIWGDRVNPSVLVMDSMLNISFDLESREFNGRWYTDSRAWKIEPADGSIHSTPVAGAPVAGAPASQPQAPEAAPFTANEEGKDDLPF